MEEEGAGWLRMPLPHLTIAAGVAVCERRRLVLVRLPRVLLLRRRRMAARRGCPRGPGAGARRESARHRL